MSNTKRTPDFGKPSEDFAAYCEAEFERRLNAGGSFDQRLYQKARDMVLDRLIRLEEERDA
jgi:hypothetical protein